MSIPARTPDYFHVDVFASNSLRGNGLCVFPQADHWSTQRMQELTREMRQFESIFLQRVSEHGAEVRIFTMEEELGFAGHPLLGAAAVLHRMFKAPQDQEVEHRWTLQLQDRRHVQVYTKRKAKAFSCTMNQGEAEISDKIAQDALSQILNKLSLTVDDLDPIHAARVISTGLAYLVLPVRGEALARTKIVGTQLEAALQTLGAKFVFVVDVAHKEIRTWDNLGQVEDIATGSAIGPAIAYLLESGLAKVGEQVTWQQGRFTGRPSQLLAWVDEQHQVWVSGEVWPYASGYFDCDLD